MVTPAGNGRRTARLAGVVAALLLVLAAGPASAVVDVTGTWVFTYWEPVTATTFHRSITLTQVGTTLTVANPSVYDDCTIDPATGALYLEGAIDCSGTPPVVGGTVSADGTTISGTFAEHQMVGICFPANGTFTAARASGTCGDGVVDAGESCDGGPCCNALCRPQPRFWSCGTASACSRTPECDGAGTCMQTPLAAGTTCRAATNTCDTAEVCDGTALTCPPPSSPTGPDVDGDGVLDPCDTCLGAPLEKVRLTMGRFGAGPGKESVSLRARVRLPDADFPQPNGLSKTIVVRDATRATIIDERVPGTTSTSSSYQWRQKGDGWVFTSNDLVNRPIARLQMKPVRKDPTAWDVRVDMPQATLPDEVGTLPLALEIELARTGHTSLDCGRLVFGLPGAPSPSCSAPSGKGMVRCR